MKGSRAVGPALLVLGAIAVAQAVAYVSLAAGLDILDPLIGLAITVVMLRITWQSWRMVRGHGHVH